MAQRKITLGSSVKIWHSGPEGIKRGHDYIAVAKDPVNKRVLLLKANSFNKDGTIHASVKKPQKSVPYVDITKNVSSVRGITYAKKKLKDISVFADINKILPDNAVMLTADDKFFCSTKG